MAEFYVNLNGIYLVIGGWYKVECTDGDGVEMLFSEGKVTPFKYSHVAKDSDYFYPIYSANATLSQAIRRELNNTLL